MAVQSGRARLCQKELRVLHKATSASVVAWLNISCWSLKLGRDFKAADSSILRGKNQSQNFVSSPASLPGFDEDTYSLLRNTRATGSIRALAERLEAKSSPYFVWCSVSPMVPRYLQLARSCSNLDPGRLASTSLSQASSWQIAVDRITRRAWRV